MTWSRPTTIGTASPRAGHSLSAYGRRLYVFGGGDNGVFYNDVQILDTGNQSIRFVN